jgi:hypothetical protein
MLIAEGFYLNFVLIVSAFFVNCNNAKLILQGTDFLFCFLDNFLCLDADPLKKVAALA